MTGFLTKAEYLDRYCNVMCAPDHSCDGWAQPCRQMPYHLGKHSHGVYDYSGPGSHAWEQHYDDVRAPAPDNLEGEQPDLVTPDRFRFRQAYNRWARPRVLLTGAVAFLAFVQVALTVTSAVLFPGSVLTLSAAFVSLAVLALAYSAFLVTLRPARFFRTWPPRTWQS